MDIEHLGDAVVGQLVDRGLVRDFADLYRLRAAALEALQGLGPKSARNLLDAIEASRDRGLARLLNGLGIRLVGKHMARLLARRLRRLDRPAAKNLLRELAAREREARKRRYGRATFSPDRFDNRVPPRADQ